MFAWTPFDLIFLKVVGAFLILFGLMMGALFPAEDYEPKKRYIGFMFPALLVLSGLLCWIISQ